MSIILLRHWIGPVGEVAEVNLATEPGRPCPGCPDDCIVQADREEQLVLLGAFALQRRLSLVLDPGAID